MEVVEDNVGIGQMACDSRYIGLGHVDGNRLDAGLGPSELSPEGIEGIGAFAFSDEDDTTTNQVHHDGQVLLPFADTDFVDRDYFQPLERWFGEASVQISLLNVFDQIPTDPEQPGDTFDGHVLAQAQHEPFKCARVGSARIGELDFDAPDRAALQALDSGDGELDEHGLQAYRQRPEDPTVDASLLDPAATAYGATQVLTTLADFDHGPSLGEQTTNKAVASDAETVIQQARGHACPPLCGIDSSQSHWARMSHFFNLKYASAG